MNFTSSRTPFTISMLVHSAWTGPPAPAHTGWDTCSSSLALWQCSSTSYILIRLYCLYLPQQLAAARAHFSPKKCKRPSKKAIWLFSMITTIAPFQRFIWTLYKKEIFKILIHFLRTCPYSRIQTAE